MTASAPAGRVLAVGFGITVGMWAVGYVSRLPFILAPSPLVLAALLVCPLAVGFAVGRRAAGGIRLALLGGTLAGVLNLLVLGSFLSATDAPNTIRPAALLFVPGSILVAAALAAAGAALGARRRVDGRPPDWTAAFAKVAAAATFLLVIVGGLVTSEKAGLAVVDWPNSFGYNMFLYPFSRMTGGIYYEHAHRLFGSLVGLTTIVLAIHLRFADPRRWLRRLAAAAVVLVIVQGILGGLRVTGKFTLSDDPSLTEPNTYLAVAHGVLGQLFLSTMVAIAVFASRAWKEASSRGAAFPRSDRTLTVSLVGALVAQLALGAIQRHLAMGLAVHIAMACVVFLLAVTAGLRAWTSGRAVESVHRAAGAAVVAVVVVQFLLGLSAFILTQVTNGSMVPFLVTVAVTTLHQATGAALLAASVVLAAWARRRPAPAPALAEGQGLASSANPRSS